MLALLLVNAVCIRWATAAPVDNVGGKIAYSSLFEQYIAKNK
jgi:hypothetical protein